MGITLEEYLKQQNENPTIDESIVQKYVVRNNKKVRKFISNKPGFKVVYDNGRRREEKESKQEEINRKLGARRGSAKRKNKNIKKRLNSFKARRRMNIGYNKENPAQRTVDEEK